MALRDELDKLVIERQNKEAQMLTDEEVYQVLLNAMYQSYIIDEIKSEVARGKTIIEGEFPLRFSMYLNEKLDWDRLVDNSIVYTKMAGYDDPDSCCFRDLYTYQNQVTHFKKRISFTTLGQRVYDDLRKLAQKDQVVLSAPITYYWDHPHGVVGALKVRYQYRYR